MTLLGFFLFLMGVATFGNAIESLPKLDLAKIVFARFLIIAGMLLLTFGLAQNFITVLFMSV